MVDLGVSSAAGAVAAPTPGPPPEKKLRRATPPVEAPASSSNPGQTLTQSCELLECGGGGRCGYNALACGIALKSGKTFKELSPTLVSKGRTVHNDLYLHLEKHPERYQSLFCPDPSLSGK